jgi:hypothetical protein
VPRRVICQAPFPLFLCRILTKLEYIMNNREEIEGKTDSKKANIKEEAQPLLITVDLKGISEHARHSLLGFAKEMEIEVASAILQSIEYGIVTAIGMDEQILRPSKHSFHISYMVSQSSDP